MPGRSMNAVQSGPRHAFLGGTKPTRSLVSFQSPFDPTLPRKVVGRMRGSAFVGLTGGRIGERA